MEVVGAQFFEDIHYELYNLTDDIGETTNLAESNPTKVKELADIMNKWRKDVGAQMPTQNPNYNPKRANQNAEYVEER
jgi:arylsulfatase A